MAEEEVDPQEIFRILVNDFESKVKLPNQMLYSNFPRGTDHVAYFKKHSKYFIVFEKDNGTPCMVGARTGLLKLCRAYGPQRSRCNSRDCVELHLCMDHVRGYCPLGTQCPKDHHFQNAHNGIILAELGLNTYEGDRLIHLLRMSVPQVCRWHNKHVGGCRNRDACTRFHVCGDFVLDKCVAVCAKGHDFDRPHSRRLLEAYNLSGKTNVEIKTNLILHRIRPGTRVDDDPVMMRNRLQRLLRGEDDDDADRDLTEMEAVRIEAPAERRNLGTAELLQDDNMLEMLKGALGDEDEDDLMALLCYQQELDSQKTIEAVPADETKGKDTAMKVDEPGKTEQTQTPEGATGGLPKKVATENAPQVLAAYTGYAPQDDREYLCVEALKNTCKKDAGSCPYAHYTSPFLWQVRVQGTWYNLDTVNEDVEKAFKQEEVDYITTMPVESPEHAGELMTIQYNRMRAELTKAADHLLERRMRFRRLFGDRSGSFPIRRLVCHDSIEERTVELLKDVPADRFEEIFKKQKRAQRKNIVIKKPAIVPYVAPIEQDPVSTTVPETVEVQPQQTEKPVTATGDSVQGMQPVVGTATGKTPVAQEVPAVQGTATFQWQVLIDDTWHDLKEANEEIEMAHKDLAPDYTTVIPAAVSGGTDDKFIEISFKDMMATYLLAEDENDGGRIKVRRFDKDCPPEPGVTATKKDRKSVKNVTPATETIPETAVNKSEEGTAAQGSGVWSWSKDEVTWTEHTEEVSSCLDDALKAGKRTGVLNIGGRKFKVNFEQWTQTCKEDKEVNYLRRQFKE